MARVSFDLAPARTSAPSGSGEGRRSLSPDPGSRAPSGRKPSPEEQQHRQDPANKVGGWLSRGEAALLAERRRGLDGSWGKKDAARTITTEMVMGDGTRSVDRILKVGGRMGGRVGGWVGWSDAHKQQDEEGDGDTTVDWV